MRIPLSDAFANVKILYHRLRDCCGRGIDERAITVHAVLFNTDGLFPIPRNGIQQQPILRCTSVRYKYWQLWRRVYTAKVTPPRGTVIGQSSSEFIQKVTLARGTAIGQSSSNDKYLTTLCNIISILPFWSNKYETLKYEHSVRTDKLVE